MKTTSILILVVATFGQLSLTEGNCTLSDDLHRSMAVILYSHPKEKNPFELECSAVILNSYWLLAPASCLFDHKNSALFKIRVHNPDGTMVRDSTPLVANKVSIIGNCSLTF